MVKEKVSSANIKTHIFDTKFFKCNFTQVSSETDQK